MESINTHKSPHVAENMKYYKKDVSLVEFMYISKWAWIKTVGFVVLYYLRILTENCTCQTEAVLIYRF